jgi:hypothetical protein
MRLRVLAAVFAACLTAAAQTQTLTVEKLVAFVESSQKLISEGKMTDLDLARFLAKVKLTERLDDAVIEDLQGKGAGPKTIQALNHLHELSQGLTVAVPLPVKLPPKPIPPPSSEEQAAIIGEVREYSLSYSKNLPDFICTQVTRRFAAPKPGTRYGGRPGGEPSWQKQDELTIRLSYFDQKENYKLILVNSTPATQDYSSLGGSTSSGDFGTMLKEVFEPSSEARFEWDHWGTLRGQRVMAFSYTVSQARSQYHIMVKDAHLDIITGYHGLIEVDKDAHAVLRLTMVADTIPPDYPIKKADEVLDYDFTDISGKTFLLPLKGVLSSDAGDYLTRNILEFHMYRKYSAESEIKYDEDISATPAPLSEDKTKETSDQKAPAKKK